MTTIKSEELELTTKDDNDEDVDLYEWLKIQKLRTIKAREHDVDELVESWGFVVAEKRALSPIPDLYDSDYIYCEWRASGFSPDYKFSTFLANQTHGFRYNLFMRYLPPDLKKILEKVKVPADAVLEESVRDESPIPDPPIQKVPVDEMEEDHEELSFAGFESTISDYVLGEYYVVEETNQSLLQEFVRLLKEAGR